MRRRAESDLERELAHHLHELTAGYERQGYDPDEAKRLAQREFGNPRAVREHVRDEWWSTWWLGVWHDVVGTLRLFRRSPGWTFVTLLTIALGVGASTAVFSVADSMLIRPLAYRDASRIYTFTLDGVIEGNTVPLSMSDDDTKRIWQDSARTIEAATRYGPTVRVFLRSDRADGADISLRAVVIDRGFLQFTGARPLIGRNFTAEETALNGPPAILLAEGFWRRNFGGSPDVLGKVVRIARDDGTGVTPRTIVGVLRASLTPPDFEEQRNDVWLPRIDGTDSMFRGITVRLRPGQSEQAASAELAAMVNRGGRLDSLYGLYHPRVRLSRPQDDPTLRQVLLLLTGAVVFLLLIACGNVSHLLLQRGLTRERELAIRHALGAGRRRLVRQLVTESTVLAFAGGALAMFLAWLALEGLLRLRPDSVPALSYLSTTRDVVPLAAGLAIAVGMAVGVLGAVHVAHGRLGESLRSGASSASVRHRRLRATLIVGQIALSAVLLVGAILLVRAVADLERERLGFEPRDLYGVSFEDLKMAESAQAMAAFADSVRDHAMRTLGSHDITIGGDVFRSTSFTLAVETADRPGAVRPPAPIPTNAVAPDFFSKLQIPLSGRSFDTGPLALDEVIVNRALARRLWHDDHVIGRQLRDANPKGAFHQWHTVVGVADDMLANRLDRESKPILYQPFPGNWSPNTTLIVRLHRQDAADLLRRFAKSVQPDPLRWVVRDIQGEIDASTAEPRFTMAVLLFFAVCGVLLAAIGLFGVVSYTLSQRTREIGVRLALGASRRDIFRLLLGDALTEVAIGTALGLVGAPAMTRLARTMVYGVHGFDTVTFILAAAFVLLASVTACAEPLFRATKLAPTVAIATDL